LSLLPKFVQHLHQLFTVHFNPISGFINNDQYVLRGPDELELFGNGDVDICSLSGIRTIVDHPLQYLLNHAKSFMILDFWYAYPIILTKNNWSKSIPIMKNTPNEIANMTL